MDKLLWALTESSPYLNVEGSKFLKDDQIDIAGMSVEDMEILDLR